MKLSVATKPFVHTIFACFRGSGDLFPDESDEMKHLSKETCLVNDTDYNRQSKSVDVINCQH